MYEGCSGILSDGRMCALSVNGRTQDMRKKGGFINPHHRDRAGHHCCPLGQGIPMYGFQIRVTRRTLQIWEKVRTELFGVTGANSPTP